LRPGFHTGGFTVAFGHEHPLVLYNESEHNNILAFVGKPKKNTNTVG